MIERDLAKRRKKGGISEHLKTSLFEQEKKEQQLTVAAMDWGYHKKRR